MLLIGTISPALVCMYVLGVCDGGVVVVVYVCILKKKKDSVSH